MTAITVARGDGIGPEIMDATLDILKAAGADLQIEEIEIGKAVYERGHASGIEDASWESLKRTQIFLKAPITTPQGGGFKSLNVTVRKTLGLYSNVRPCVSYHPVIETKHPNMDVVIVRENEEDLYAGIEHRQSQDVYQCLKLISRQGCERIVRYAFDYARANNRKKVTAFVKDNIMKMTDGIFHKVFKEIAEEYPDITSDHMIIDIGTARLADTPDMFDVIVTLNLYGDIISDVAAQITGSVGLAGSANIGEKCAMFEAIHGSAPDIAGKGIANPSGLLLAAVQMLVHIGQGDIATKIHNAWLSTIEDGIHTGDIYKEGLSRKRVNTQEFKQAVLERLEQRPAKLTPVSYASGETARIKTVPVRDLEPQQKELIGVDIFVDYRGCIDSLAEKISAACGKDFRLSMISSRGLALWPEGPKEDCLVDHLCCRVFSMENITAQHKDILNLLSNIEKHGIDFIKIENLYLFDKEPGFSAGQGQ